MRRIRNRYREWKLDLADKIAADIRRYIRNEGRDVVRRGDLSAVSDMLVKITKTPGIPRRVYEEIRDDVLRQALEIQLGVTQGACLESTIAESERRRRLGLHRL